MTGTSLTIRTALLDAESFCLKKKSLINNDAFSSYEQVWINSSTSKSALTGWCVNLWCSRENDRTWLEWIIYKCYYSMEKWIMGSDGNLKTLLLPSCFNSLDFLIVHKYQQKKYFLFILHYDGFSPTKIIGDNISIRKHLTTKNEHGFQLLWHLQHCCKYNKNVFVIINYKAYL